MGASGRSCAAPRSWAEDGTGARQSVCRGRALTDPRCSVNAGGTAMWLLEDTLGDYNLGLKLISTYSWLRNINCALH